MRRYEFLNPDEIYAALNRLRDAFLAAKDGREVEEIIDGLLTRDEKLKIGRRILIAEYLESGMKFDEIVGDLKVGKNTILAVLKNLEDHPNYIKLIHQRSQKVEKVYSQKKEKLQGGSTLIHKKKVYTGFKRSDIER